MPSLTTAFAHAFFPPDANNELLRAGGGFSIRNELLRAGGGPRPGDVASVEALSLSACRLLGERRRGTRTTFLSNAAQSTSTAGERTSAGGGDGVPFFGFQPTAHHASVGTRRQQQGPHIISRDTALISKDTHQHDASAGKHCDN